MLVEYGSRSMSVDISQTGETAYTATIFRSVDDIDAATWDAVCSEQHDVFVSQAFIRAFERSMGHVTTFHHVVVRDAQRQPMALACLCVFQADISTIAEGLTAKIAKFFKPIARRLIEIKIVFCGLPISSSCDQLRFAPEADRAEVLQLIDEAALKLARDSKAKVITFKEFSDERCEELQVLSDLGYRRGPNLPKNQMPGGFADFDAYCQSLKSRKRSTIKRSRRKFADAGMKVEHHRGSAAVAAMFTDEVHALYLAVQARAHAKLEELPAEFFRQFAVELGDQSLFTFARDPQGKIVGFAMSVIDLPSFYQMFVGVDYAVNNDCDLYFNLFYNTVDEALRLGATTIDVGQSSDEFKRQKLGATQKNSSVFLKGVDWLTRLSMKLAFNAFLPKLESSGHENEGEE